MRVVTFCGLNTFLPALTSPHASSQFTSADRVLADVSHSTDHAILGAIMAAVTTTRAWLVPFA